jgi:uncharacterized protein (TIGR03437 family)
VRHLLIGLGVGAAGGLAAGAGLDSAFPCRYMDLGCVPEPNIGKYPSGKEIVTPIGALFRAGNRGRDPNWRVAGDLSGTMTTREGIDMRVTRHAYTQIFATVLFTAAAAAGQTGSSPVISLSSSQLQFSLNSQGVLNQPQIVSITNSGGGTLVWSATSNAPWLLISPAAFCSTSQSCTGTAPSALAIYTNPNGLQPGTYTGVITVTAVGASNSPQIITVTLTLPGIPTPPSPYAIQNSASYAPEVAQGSIFVITGTNLGPAQLAQAPANSLPVQLAGTTVQVVAGGAIVDCPIAYTSATQIAAVLPSGTPLGPGSFTVSYNGQMAGPDGIQVVSSGVGIYTVASSGIGTGIITDTNYVIKTLSQPAKPGDIVIAWATGLGPIKGNDAIVAPSPLFTNVDVLVGDQPATVIAAGRSGCCAGLDQIAFQVPATAPLGCFVPMSIRVAGGALNAAGSVSNFVTLPLSQSGGPCSDPTPGFPSALVSQAASGQPVAIGVLAIGTGPILPRLAPFQANSLASPVVLAGQLSKALRVTVPEGDAVRLLRAYRSGDTAAVRKILARYRRELKNNPVAQKLLRAAAQSLQQQAAVAAFGVGNKIGLVGPEYASDFPAPGTCTILQNFPADPSARLPWLDAGSTLTVNGPEGQKVMSQVSGGQYSVMLGAGPSPTDATPGFYTISGTGGKNVGPFSVSLNVANPVTWTNKSAINIVDRTQPLTLTWSGGAASGHVLIGGNVRVSNSVQEQLFPNAGPGALLLCTESAQTGTFTIPQFLLSALAGGQTATLFIAPHPLDNPVSIPGLDVAYFANGSSDSRTVTVQ